MPTSTVVNHHLEVWASNKLDYTFTYQSSPELYGVRLRRRRHKKVQLLIVTSSFRTARKMWKKLGKKRTECVCITASGSITRTSWADVNLRNVHRD